MRCNTEKDREVNKLENWHRSDDYAARLMEMDMAVTLVEYCLVENQERDVSLVNMQGFAVFCGNGDIKSRS
jgi:hypothetical protein